MAQAKREEVKLEGAIQEKEAKDSSSAPFKFNAQAPEFVPRSHCQLPISGYFYPCFQYLGGVGVGSDSIYVGDQEPFHLVLNTNATAAPPSSPKNVRSDDLRHKIVKQVEYQLSDISLLANDSLAKHVNKDPEGYVQISVLASLKKIRSLTSNNHLLVQALRTSSKLVVSNDGKKVKRKHAFTDKEKEELMSRTVVAENLPEDHSHQSLERIFGVVGSVRAIRICHPQESNSSRSKGDFYISNKLHAFVEYETTETAERAVEKLCDERNWRKGLRVRLLLRLSPKSVLKSRKSDFDGILDDDELLQSESAEESSQPHNTESNAENNPEENPCGSKKGWARGRGKIKGRLQNHIGRTLLTAPSLSSGSVQCEASPKQTTKGPRMPDGTRGFSAGRGKPVNTLALARSHSE